MACDYVTARGLRSQSKIKANAVSGPNDEAAVLCTREEGGSIWQSEVRPQEAAETTPLRGSLKMHHL